MIKIKKNKRGFTLIELLAVIVILAVIALIVTPLVLNIIEHAEKGAFKDSVYGIMEAAEFQVILDDSKYPITYVFPDDSQSIKFKGTKPSEGYIQIVTEGKMKLALGNGRWCATKEINDSQVTVQNGHCEKIELNRPIISGYGDLNQEIDLNETYTMPNVTAVDKDGNKLNVITTIKQGDTIVDKIDTTKASTYTITYTTDPDKEGNTSSITITVKVIKQETDTDKVIASGLTDGGLELIDGTYYYRGSNPNNYIQFNGVTGDDSLWRIISIENGYMKLIKNTSTISRGWDTSGSYGNNNWTRPATSNTYLNDTYYNSLPSSIQNKIQSAPFYIGAVSYDFNINAATVKTEERQSIWNGYVGLINVSDYAYASTDSSCQTQVLSNVLCKNNNWLYDGANSQWTINANNGTDSWGLAASYIGGISETRNFAPKVIRPVIHLKSDIKIISGNGREDTPFIIQ